MFESSALRVELQILKDDVTRLLNTSSEGIFDASTSRAHTLAAPLDRSDRIDPILWREHREACRIARLRRDKEDEHGRLVHRQGGGWAFHYDAGVNTPDEVGFHFENQRFLAGEYVSINDAGKMHTYRVVSVNRL
jgi:hypothetical protein